MKGIKATLMVLVVLVAAASMVMAGGAAEDDPVVDDISDVEIGLVNAGPDDYYYRLFDVYEALAEDMGWDVQMLNSENNPEREVSNVQDLIVRGVDAIGIITANAVSAGEAAALANEAGIPIFAMVGVPDEEATDGRVDGHVGFSYYDMGYMNGQWVAENHPDAEIVTIDGFYGQGTAEAHFEGINDALADAGTGQEAVSVGTGEWQRTEAIPVAQDLLASDRDFDIVYVMNEEMTAGVLQVFEEQGVDDKMIITANAKEEGIEWIRDPDVPVYATAPDPPSLTAHLSFQQMKRTLMGEDIGPRHLEVRAELITEENLDAAIPWIAEDYLAGVEANAFEWELDHYIEQMGQ